MAALSLPLALFTFPLLGYLCGSLSFAVWVTRLVKGLDVREVGSKHATTTNTLRTAGFGWGALVFVLDTTKGFVPTWLALHHAPAPWIAGLTAAMVVMGHCWPVFAGFRGGMGMASLGGCVLAASLLAYCIGLIILIVLTLILRHHAQACLSMAPPHGLTDPS
jgi:glycerol-3-phosphate acyltransferase PlsY